MKKDVLYSVLKILLIAVAVLDVAYLAFVVWQSVAYTTGAVLTLRTYAAVSAAALAVNLLLGAYVVVYLKIRRYF